MMGLIHFIENNMHILILIYMIGAAITFVLVNAFWIWIGIADTRDSKRYPELYEEYGENDLGWGMLLIMAALTSIGCAILWVGVPLLLAGVWFCQTVMEKFPELSGGITGEEEQENNSDNMEEKEQ